MSTLLWLSILLCLIIGGAIGSSEMCLCRASTNLTIGKPALAIGLLVVTAAASVIFYVDTAMAWHHQPVVWSYPSWLTVLGAAMFALGTVLNDACAVGTIGRLARGDVGHLATFAGALVVVLLLPHRPAGGMQGGASPVGGLGWLFVILAVATAILILGRAQLAHLRLGPYLVLGVVGAIITDWEGNTTWLWVFQHLQAGVHLAPAAFAGVIAMVVGAAVVAIVRGDFQLLRPSPLAMLREFVGGGLMVGGAILIPGANFILAVYGVPSGNPNAIVGYLLMFVMMLGMLWMKRAYLVWSAARDVPKILH